MHVLIYHVHLVYYEWNPIDNHAFLTNDITTYHIVYLNHYRLIYLR
ncbi:unnamed protein product [Schistosoma margrebowiei]|uniref:Uncharacterized protein n=1 Tax=Schistosoma margrebowiei TaxID=48269 RepID=A0A183MZT6_9TREM|nr:unnamed protein product [Schistosoma margrebowiei]